MTAYVADLAAKEVESGGDRKRIILPWPKKIETGTQAKHRRVHARQITRLCHVRAVVSIFLARVVVDNLPIGQVQ